MCLGKSKCWYSNNCLHFDIRSEFLYNSQDWKKISNTLVPFFGLRDVSRNPYWKGRRNTVDLLVRIPCFVNEKNRSELVSTRWPNVLSLPLQKVFPGFFLSMGVEEKKSAVKLINFHNFCRLRFYSVFALEISSLVLGSNSGGNLIKLFCHNLYNY